MNEISWSAVDDANVRTLGRIRPPMSLVALGAGVCVEPLARTMRDVGGRRGWDGRQVISPTTSTRRFSLPFVLAKKARSAVLNCTSRTTTYTGLRSSSRHSRPE